VARKLYGTTDVVGKTVIIDLTTYTVCGVVKDVSRAADTAFGDVWVPYTTDRILMTNTSSENMAGWFSICLLAKDSRDFEAIRHELLKQIERYNGMKQDAKINFFENPITRFDIAIGSIGQRKVDVKDYLLETGSLLLFLLLVPALNLLGVTQSAVQKRRAEMGVRKAFGATYGVLVRQILYENSVITLIGGLVGLLLSLLLLPVCKDFLLQSRDTALSGDMIFQPAVFLLALFFSLLLNLLSAGIPAMRIARQKIVISLKDGE
jgi:putative ABC transport system permease protein